MISALVVGLALGLRHALEADHIAAVAAVVTGISTPRSAAVRGAFWGVGHTVTLLVFGGTFLVLGLEISAATERVLELVVGLMLVAIGFDAMRSLRRLHVHEHEHTDGTSHVHVHAHESAADHAAASHRHSHRAMSSVRALGVGMVHGLAGSAALVVLAAESLSSPASGIGFIVLFGVGSIAGMTVMSVVVALPVQLSARYYRRHVPRVVFGAGALSAAVGVHLVVMTALA